MNRVIVQVPMSKELRTKAQAVALEEGFSSLQEAVRLFVNKFAQRELRLVVRQELPEEIIHLSPQAKRRYATAIRDIKQGKNVTKTKNLDELFALLGYES